MPRYGMKWPSVYIIDRTKEYAILKIKFIKNDNLLMAIKNSIAGGNIS